MSEFGQLNLQDMQGEDKRVNTEANNTYLDNFVPMPKPKPGQTAVLQVRILPPRKGGRLFEYTRIHNVNGRKVHDPKRLVDGKWDKSNYNPIVDYYNSLWRDADKLEAAGNKEAAELKKKEARSIKPIERYYYNAIVRKMTDKNGQVLTDVGPRILSVGKTVHKMIVRAIVGDESEAPLGDITDPVNGYDFIFKVEMRGTGDEAFQNYDRSCFAREPSPLGTPEQIKLWAENLHDLTKCHVVTAPEILDKELAIHRGLIPDEAQGFDVNKFDQKYKQNTSKPTDTPAIADETLVDPSDINDDTTPPPAADVPIEDTEFLARLQEMDEQG